MQRLQTTYRPFLLLCELTQGQGYVTLFGSTDIMCTVTHRWYSRRQQDRRSRPATSCSAPSSSQVCADTGSESILSKHQHTATAIPMEQRPRKRPSIAADYVPG